MKGETRRTIGARMRAAAVLLAGVVAMHWLCYLPRAGGGSGVGEALHERLAAATPLLLALAMLVVLASLAVSFGSPRAEAPASPSFEAQAARFAAALLVVFVVQEASELILGEASGPDAVLGAAGWLVVPAALFVGALAAFASRTLAQVEHRLVGEGSTARGLPEPDTEPLSNVRRSRRLATRGLAFGLARRPPPLALPAD